MRLLFGFLLLVSVVLFVLMQWGGALTGAAKNGQILAELNPEKIILLDKPGTGQLPASAVVAVVQSAVAASAPAAISMPATPVPAASAPLPASAPAETVVSPPPPASAPAPAPAIPGVNAHGPVQALKGTVNACMKWGEFSGADLAHAMKSLSAMSLGERLAQRTVEYTSAYWVYIPQLKSKAAVNSKIAQIKALGVADYFVVHEPPKLVNVISLGVFKTREAANNYLASLQKKGVRSAIVGERKRRLKFVVFEFKRIDTGVAARLSSLQKEFPYSELKTVPCNNELR